MKLALVALLASAQAVDLMHASAGDPPSAANLPRPDHVVIVIEENRAYDQIIGSILAPYVNTLAHGGALFSQSYAVAHPSQPNYLALFSGSTQGMTDDSCPHTFAGENLATVLARASLKFAIYSESLPAAGYTGCNRGSYNRKHNPVANWPGMPADVNLPFTSFPTNYALLPDVAIVVPNADNDMHDWWGPYAVYRSDAWLKEKLNGYVDWAKTHNSLLIVTWDEDDGSPSNRIPTIFVGPMVRKGVYPERIDHYRLLRSILAMYSLPPIGRSVDAQPIADVWALTHKDDPRGKVLTPNTEAADRKSARGLSTGVR